MVKKVKKSNSKKPNLIKRAIWLLVITFALYIFGIGTLFIPALQNLKENPCTHVPLLSDWGIIPKCPATQTCISDNYCTWTLDIVDNKCNFSAYNYYESRCSDDKLGEYTKYLETDWAKKAGFDREVEICYDLSHVAINYKAAYWWRSLDYCNDKVSKVEAYCKKTDFDTYSKGLGQCVIKFEE